MASNDPSRTSASWDRALGNGRRNKPLRKTTRTVGRNAESMQGIIIDRTSGGKAKRQLDLPEMNADVLFLRG